MSFTFPQKILFKHCDPAGIVFYPRYFEMINDCVETFFDSVLHTPFEELHKTGGIPTAQISASFSTPSRHGDHLNLCLTPTKIGRSSLSLSFIARCHDQARFQAKSTLVYIGKDGKPTSWPDELRNSILPLIGDIHDV